MTSSHRTSWFRYADTLIGARFAGHPMALQFKTNPRAAGVHVIATLDETSYTPKGVGGQDLHMGDHPIAWTRSIDKGRSFYSAIGHRPETYSEPHHVRLL